MASLKIVVENSQYSGDFIGYSPVVADGLLVWAFLGGSEATSLSNHARGKPDLVSFGGVSYASGFASTGNGSYFQSDASETSDMTILAVSRAPGPWTGGGDTIIPKIGGNYLLPDPGNPNPEGFHFGYREYPDERGRNLIFRQALGNGYTSRLRLPSENLESWTFSAAKMDGNLQSIFNKTEQTSDTKTISNTIIQSDRKITVGGLADRYKGNLDIAFFAYYNRALSNAEIDAIYEQVRIYMASKSSITV